MLKKLFTSNTKAKDAEVREGLFREIKPEDIALWNDRITNVFPPYKNGIESFGFDWIGRAFAIDIRKESSDYNQVLLFDIGFNEVLVIPADKESFYSEQITNNTEAALALSFYQKWLAKTAKRPSYSECVGYRIPLFLGGKDEVKNLEIINIDVYWSLTGQLIEQLNITEENHDS